MSNIVFLAAAVLLPTIAIVAGAIVYMRETAAIDERRVERRRKSTNRRAL